MERTERLELFTLVMMHGMLSAGVVKHNTPDAPDNMDEFILLSRSAVAMADALGSALDRALASPPAP